MTTIETFLFDCSFMTSCRSQSMSPIRHIACRYFKWWILCCEYTGVVVRSVIQAKPPHGVIIMAYVYIVYLCSHEETEAIMVAVNICVIRSILWSNKWGRQKIFLALTVSRAKTDTWRLEPWRRYPRGQWRQPESHNIVNQCSVNNQLSLLMKKYHL
jgi:hypothetical protein